MQDKIPKISEPGKDVKEVINSLLEWLNSNIEKKRWDNDKLEQKFGKRSAMEILKDGDTFYMNPCLDYTLVTYEILRRNSFRPSIAIDELIQKLYDFHNLHFALEFKHKNQPYYLDFTQLNKVLLGRGMFSNERDDVTVFQTLRIRKELDPEKNIFENLSEYEEKLMDFRIERVLKQIKKDNTPKTYKSYLDFLGKNSGLYVEMVR